MHGQQNIKTHFLFNNFLFPPKNRAVYEIIWKNMVEPDRPQKTIWRMRTARWITKDPDTLIAIPLQKWLRESASILRHTYMDCLVEHSSPTRSDTISSSDSSRRLKGSCIFVFGYE